MAAQQLLDAPPPAASTNHATMPERNSQPTFSSVLFSSWDTEVISRMVGANERSVAPRLLAA